MRAARVLSLAACVAPVCWSAGPASAASYFCSPTSIKLGTYQPDDSAGELDIRVTLPLERFWFDDRTGDYQADGTEQSERGKLTVPLDTVANDGSLSFLVRATFDAGQCVASGIGIHPTTSNAATESMTK